jgi:predicted DNA binding CopG/RHH family protein
MAVTTDRPRATKKRRHVSLRLSDERHTALVERAEAEGRSVQAHLLELVKADLAANGIPNKKGPAASQSPGTVTNAPQEGVDDYRE